MTAHPISGDAETGGDLLGAQVARSGGGDEASVAEQLDRTTGDGLDQLPVGSV